MQHSWDRGQFLNMAGLVEGGLVFVALFLGWMSGIDPLESLTWNWPAVAWGVLATIPLLTLYFVIHRFPVGPLAPIKQLLIELLGPLLAMCRWYDLILLAALAGFGEELVFRGVLQPWIATAGPMWGLSATAVGLLGSNVLFGMLHFITPTYAILAGVMGLYLGFLLDGTGEKNLLIPIITHGLYDYMAFLLVIRTYMAGRKSPDNLRLITEKSSDNTSQSSDDGLQD